LLQISSKIGGVATEDTLASEGRLSEYEPLIITTKNWLFNINRRYIDNYYVRHPKRMKRKTLFNQGWLFVAEELPLNAPDELFINITLPHTNQTFPHNNVEHQAYEFISTYRKRFDYNHNQSEKLIFLDFDGVMLACKVYLNGKFLYEHLGGFTSFSVDITSVLQPGENLLTVYVDSRERKDIPPFGHLVDYLTFGGIYRDVYLRTVHQTHIQDLFVQTSRIFDSPGVICDVTLSNIDTNLSLDANLYDPIGKIIASTQTNLDGYPPRVIFSSLPEINLWSLEGPNLYTIEISVFNDNVLLDTDSVRFGFRTCEFKPDGGFYLNGERIKLFGLNRHQTYPYIGAAAPARLQKRDAEILKFELGCNIVRTSHYPQSPHFLNRCDEIGLLVFEEIPGWQHIGDEDWQNISLNELETMIKRDRNHPSIILWGVRINESLDDDAFYTKTNALAHQLDSNRQTGGVRFFMGSSFLEDVYTYNDFSNSVQEPQEQPHLITEFAGHMFPTKIFDHEERLIEHALLHAKIQDLQMGNPKIAGAIGWCAFDYATHIEFGSGDRICYHGVMDVYRNPKWAAYFYQSQQDPSCQIILQAATHWTMGDRSAGGNDPLTVFSNCDQVEVIIGDHSLGKFNPDRDNYPHLNHPPFTIPIALRYTAWGQSEFHDLHLVGFIEGEPVKEQWIASNKLPTRLELVADTEVLIADGSDMTRLTCKVTDRFGNPLPYAFKIVRFELIGPAELIGENPLVLVGGAAGVYIKAQHQAGEVLIRAKTDQLPDASMELKIIQL
jgi:beta-galactosidase